MLPTLTAKGLRATGIEKLRSERIELNDFLTEIERLVNAERKKDK